jgi:protein SCO1/2
MTGFANILGILVMCLVVAGLDRNCRAASQGPGLLEQSKQVLAGKSGDGGQWIEEKTGRYLPLDLEFVDEEGKSVRFGDIIDRPTLLLPIYFYCPNICSKNLANLAIALNNLSFQPGKEYRVIALSFNEAEGFQDAARAKRNYLKILDEGFPAGEWRFLTGKKEAIKAATDAVGFRFQKIDDETFIHPAALMAIAADGKIVRYVFGSFLAGDIDVALSAAASGTPALSVRRLLGFCFNYDPNTNKSVFQTVKIGILVLFGVVLAGLWLFFRRRGRNVEKAVSTDSSSTQDKKT